MKCVICGQAETTVTRIKITAGELEIRNVPARVCPHCGETYVEEQVASRLLESVRGLQLNEGNKVIFFDTLPNVAPEDQATILDRIQHRRYFMPEAEGAPSSTALLREDRAR